MVKKDLLNRKVFYISLAVITAFSAMLILFPGKANRDISLIGQEIGIGQDTGNGSNLSEIKNCTAEESNFFDVPESVMQKSDNTEEAKETVRERSSTGAKIEDEDHEDIEYIESSLILPTGVDESSETVKTLMLFYRLLLEEQYDNAYDLLDDKFVLSAFKIFGASEISKEDIDVGIFSDFLKAIGIFKLIKLEEIIDVKYESGLSRICYYQSFNAENGDKIVLPLVIVIKKSNNDWKITALEDGNPNSPPFR